jgi:peptidyl-Lys metalloendopeptidase
MLFRTLLAALLVCVSFAGHARSNNLAVSLSLPDRATANDREMLVDIVFTNKGETPIAMVKWYLPDGELEGDLFALARDGQPVNYVGPIVKRAAPALQDLIALAPGESITRTVDLAVFYDMTQTGNYDIQYAATAQEMFGHKSPRGFENLMEGKRLNAESSAVESQAIVSNKVSTFVEGRANALMEQSLDKSVAFSGRCSATQQSTIGSAVGAAQTMANGSVNYLNGTPGATPRFTTWFGTYSSANWNQVKSHYVNIKDALDNKPLVFDCACKKSYYAYVFANQPYKIYLCRAFWTAPLTGTDSKGGTIVHELSHFTVIAGTSDYAYGQSLAKQLAISNPAQARQNADSHEYFAENTPSQP